MNKDTSIIIRIDKPTKELATKIAKENNLGLTDLITASLKDIIKRGKVPLFLYPYLSLNQKQPTLSIAEIKKSLEKIINKQGKGLVKKAYLFGSFARNEMKPTSDIDIRLETDNGLTLIDLGNIRLDLKEAFQRDVDLICAEKEDLDPSFYNEIKKDEICIYER